MRHSKMMMRSENSGSSIGRNRSRRAASSSSAVAAATRIVIAVVAVGLPLLWGLSSRLPLAGAAAAATNNMAFITSSLSSSSNSFATTTTRTRPRPHSSRIRSERRGGALVTTTTRTVIDPVVVGYRRSKGDGLVRLAMAAANANDDQDSSETRTNFLRTTPSEDERPVYPKARRSEIETLSTASSAGERPGAIIEDEQQLETKATILQEINSGVRQYKNAEWLQEVFGEDTDIPADDEIDDGDDEDQDQVGDRSTTAMEDTDSMDSERLGTWTIEDLRSKFDYEWDPNGDAPDPNLVSLNQPSVRYVEQPPASTDDPNVEMGYDPIFGPSSPIDRRTILGARDSYMVDPATRDETRLRPQFASDDPELQFNQDVVEFRQAMDIMETFIDPFLPDLEIPRHVAKWHGYPEMQFFEPKPFENNRFTHSKDRTDFTKLDPHRARQKAVELARAKNAEWLPSEVSHTFHEQQRAPYESYQTLVGTLRKQEEPIDEDLLEQIQPALQVFGSSVELLSINDGVYRFHYHGLMKNRHGMAAWMTSLLKEECAVELVTGVVMETGFRQRDPAYDGGDPWYAPIG